MTVGGRIGSSWTAVAARIAREPPFRLMVRAALRCFDARAEVRARWELSARPAYMLGVYTAAEQARRQNVRAISVIEFGVASGEGLIALQHDAAITERDTGVAIRVFGFDRGPSGLPRPIGDYRDHPEAWRAGDYPMDERALRPYLEPRTRLLLGDVADTVPRFFAANDVPPVGFVSFDLDFYSSTRDALRLFTTSNARMLWHVPLYFDDTEFLFNHRRAGELLAIDEFNTENHRVYIDHWHGVRTDRPFPERGYLDRLYVAHDLTAISAAGSDREAVELPLRRGGRNTLAARRQTGRLRDSREAGRQAVDDSPRDHIMDAIPSDCRTTRTD